MAPNKPHLFGKLCFFFPYDVYTRPPSFYPSRLAVKCIEFKACLFFIFHSPTLLPFFLPPTGNNHQAFPQDLAAKTRTEFISSSSLKHFTTFSWHIEIPFCLAQLEDCFSCVCYLTIISCLNLFLPFYSLLFSLPNIFLLDFPHKHTHTVACTHARTYNLSFQKHSCH